MPEHTHSNHAPAAMGRRDFLVSTAAAGLAAGTAFTASAQEHGGGATGDAGGKPPNVLVITTDQQWAGAMSCVGNPYLDTPAMDSLARHGVQFEAAYSPNPICVPARTSYMTGTLPHENGVITNLRPPQIDLTAPCLAKVFKDNGYETGHVGKWHVPRSIEDREWSGFDYLAAVRNNRVDFDIPDACEEFLRSERDKPFFLIASFVNPHDICEWARIHSGIEDDLPNGDVGAPPPPEECPPFRPNKAIPEGEPSAVREHQADEGMARAYPTREWDDDDGRWRQYLWGYYRMTELVDSYIGDVLDVLRDIGEEENTIIVFSSDHGDGIGSHRWNQKTIFYDEISRVPFIVSWKGHTKPAARDTQHLINLGTDLFPTLFELAGIEKPEGLRGISAARAALGHPDGPKHGYIVVENNHHSGFGEPTDVNGRMVRSARYKYIRYNKGEPTEQLFDMELDPGEVRDLTLDPDSRDILEDHRRMLDEYIAETNDDFPPFGG